MKLCIMLTVLGGAALIPYLAEKLHRFTPRAVLRKTLVSAFFVCTAIAASAVTQKAGFARLVLAGLIFGLFGDVWLDLKFVYPADDEVWSFAGFKSFAVGHILFMLALALNFADPARPLYVVLPLLLGAAGGVGTVLLGPVMKLEYGKFRKISMLYGALLFSVMLMAGSLALMNGFRVAALNMMFIGAVLFALSDLVLSGTYFGKGHDRAVDLIANYLSYYGAQFLIALSIALA